MKNIHILPTDKPSRLSDCHNNKLHLNDVKYLRSYKNIYITSDEEIKEGDYMLLTYEHSHGRVRKCHYIYEEQLMIDPKEDIGFGFCKRQEVYKIIITTDQDLINDGVQVIDDEFLQWIVKNPSCEEVIVDKEQYHQFVGNTKLPLKPNYKIIIPKEEPKFRFDNINIEEPTIKEIKNHKEEPKQETLEEAAESHVENPDIIAKFSENKVMYKRMFQDGAKWQQERSYSDENMRKAFCAGFASNVTSSINDAFEKWFEQFKKNNYKSITN